MSLPLALAWVVAPCESVPLDANMVTKNHTAARPGDDRSHEAWLCPVLHLLDRPARLSSSRESLGMVVRMTGPIGWASPLPVRLDGGPLLEPSQVSSNPLCGADGKRARLLASCGCLCPPWMRLLCHLLRLASLRCDLGWCTIRGVGTGHIPCIVQDDR